MTSDLSINQNFYDVLTELSAARNEYLVVGGFAVAVYGYQRATKDIDLFVRPSRENAALVLQALRKFGAPLHEVTLEETAEPGPFFLVCTLHLKIGRRLLHH